VTSSPRYATEPERTVPLAPVALALSVLVAPAGVVLGIIALRRIRREDDDAAGARTAVAAIAVGTVVTIAYVALAVAMIVLLVLLRDPATPLPPGVRT
jgi:uncharacterized membrane protein